MGAEGVKQGNGTSSFSSPTLLRYHGAAGANIPYLPANQAAATSYFSALVPWGLMGRVSMRPDGSVASRCTVNQTPLQVAANWGDNCYSDTNDNANGQQKTVYIPQFCFACDPDVANYSIYYWVGQVGDTFRTQAGADYTFTSVDIHPAFIIDGVAKSGVFIGAYEGYYDGVGKLQSVAGVAPSVNQTMATYRTSAESIGTGWEICTVQIASAIKPLFMIEYASLNSQTALGNGNSTGATAINTGGSVSGGNASYSATAVSYRGIENLWGNILSVLEGMHAAVTTAEVWIAPQSRARPYYVCGTLGTPYNDTTLALPTTNNNTPIVSVSTTTYPWAFIPQTNNGSVTTYFCDVIGVPATSTAPFDFGGAHALGTNCGLFAWSSCAACTYGALGARLCYLPG